jgi:hypothetical protein
MTNLEKKHKYLENKQRLLLQLQQVKKKKIVEKPVNGRNMFGFSIKRLK